MPYSPAPLAQPPAREALEQLPGPAVVEFGAPWCGHCQRAQPLIAQALQGRDAVRHIKVHDGPGQRLGRGFGVKLWPTLVFLRDGQETARLVRPQTAPEIGQALDSITP